MGLAASPLFAARPTHSAASFCSAHSENFAKIAMHFDEQDFRLLRPRVVSASPLHGLWVFLISLNMSKMYCVDLGPQAMVSLESSIVSGHFSSGFRHFVPTSSVPGGHWSCFSAMCRSVAVLAATAPV